jgi:hypothetical protein
MQSIRPKADVLESIWIRTVDTLTSQLEQNLAHHATLVSEFGEFGGYVIGLSKLATDPKKLFRSLVELLVQAKAEQLRAEGIAVSIDADEFVPDWAAPSFDCDWEAYHRGTLAYARTLTLLTIAQQLDDRFGADKAEDIALDQAAEVVTRFLGASKGQSIKLRGGRAIIERRFYTEPNCKPGSGHLPLSAHYDEQRALHGFAKAVSTLLASDGRHWLYPSSEFTAGRAFDAFASRAKACLGPGLTLIGYRHKIELSFDPACLEALQLALGERADQAHAA